MNKLVKGAIAGAAGIALLMGGAGSLALWNDSANITDASVTSGKLTITATTGSWTGPAVIVPGDTTTYTSTVTVTALGTNLHSTLSIDPASITGDAALKAAATVSMTIGSVTGGSLAASGSNAYEVTVAGGNATGVVTIPVTVTVSLPSTVSGTTAQNGTINLNALSFKLDQHL